MKTSLRLLGAALLVTLLAAGCPSQPAQPPATNVSTNNATTGTNAGTAGTNAATTGTNAATNNATTGTTGADTNAAAKPEPTGPVARINGVEIPRERLNQEMEQLRSQFSRFGGKMPDDQIARFKEKIVGRIVEEELISQKLKAENIQIPEEEVTKELELQKSRMPGGAEQFDAFLQRSGMSIDKIKDEIRSRLALKAYLNKDKSLDVTEDEIKKYYDENKDKFTTQERVKASHILIKVGGNNADGSPGMTDEEARKKIDEVYKLASKKGADFDAIAKAHSEGPSAPRGGDLGFFERGRMVKEFEDVAFAAKPGEVTKPVKTKFGYHVIKVLEKQPAGEQKLDEVKDQIIARIEARKFREARDKFVAQLRAEGKVELLD